MKLNWWPLCISFLLFIFSSSTSSNFLHYHNFCSRLNGKLSPFYQYVYTITVMSYFVPPIILSFSGARACVELCWYEEARSWLYMGLTVSFNECFRGDTRCNASNISRKTIRSGEILQHIMQAMFSYPTLSRLKAKILLKSSFDYSTKLYSKE